MDIKNDLLKKVLSSAFGFNLPQSNLLETSTSNDDNNSTTKLTIIDKELKNRAARRLVAEEINKQKNLEDVILRADDILQTEPQPLSHQEETDQGWIDECLDGAGKTYNDNLKDYWAKLLAGEIKNPGTYSKRAVNFMKTLSQKDAEKIRDMCQYVMYSLDKNDAFILRYEDSLYTFTDLSFLMELRLLNSSSFVVKQYRYKDEKGGVAFFLHNNVGFLLKISKKKYDLPIYSFTELGKEILSIIDDMNVNMYYLRKFSESIIEKKKELNISCGHFQFDGYSYHILLDDIFFQLPEDENENKTSNNVS